eukprot:jgi/Tetstr1/449642/TSEL_036710.t1
MLMGRTATLRRCARRWAASKQAATVGHPGDADARVMEREVEAASGLQKELTAFLDQANTSRLRNEVCALPVTFRGRILFNQLDAASGMWTVAIPTARTVMTPHKLREPVPLGNIVPRDELKDLVPDAKLSLPAFNVVTGSYDLRSLNSTLPEFKTMRYGVKYTAVPRATAVDRFERSLLDDIQRGLAARDAAWHNTEPGHEGPLRDILVMSEYTGMVFGTVGNVSKGRIAGQPTGSGGAAERPDLLELAQSGRVGAKSASAEDDYLAVPELLQRAESYYEAVRPVSRVPRLFPLSTDLTNEYLKKDDRRLPAQEEYLWMSCFGAHMAALFVALDELLPYVPAANHDFTPYLARARNHADAIDKAFRFRLAFLRRLNEIKRVHGDQCVLDVLRAQHFQPASEHLGSAIFGDLMKDYERRVFEATVASSAKATATARVAAAAACRGRGRGRGREDVAYRFVTKAELIVPAPYPEYHLDFRALLASVVNFMFFARGLTGVFCRVRDVHVDTYNITLHVYREKGRAGRRGPDDLRVLLLPVSEHPRVARILRHFIDNAQSVPLVTVGLAASNFWAVTAAEQSKPWTAATM